jgi:hypothetical protein
LIHDFSVFHYSEHGNAHHAETPGQLGPLVDVDFANLEVGPLSDDFL